MLFVQIYVIVYQHIVKKNIFEFSYGKIHLSKCFWVVDFLIAQNTVQSSTLDLEILIDNLLFARNSVKLCYILASTSYNSIAKNWHDFTLTTLGRKVLDWSGFEWNASLPDFDGAKLPSCMKPFDRDNVASFLSYQSNTQSIYHTVHMRPICIYKYIYIKTKHTYTHTFEKKNKKIHITFQIGKPNK